MDKHRNGKTDPHGSRNFAQTRAARAGQRAMPDAVIRFLESIRGRQIVVGLLLTLCCAGSISLISWIMLVVRDPGWIFFLYIPVFLILLPLVGISFFLPKSWGVKIYCLILTAMVMLWSTGLTAIIRTSPMTRLKIISGGYDSCKNSGIVWGNNNRLALCGDIDDTWFNYLVETAVVYDSSGEIAKRADQRSSAWNSTLIKLSRLYALSHYTKKEAEIDPGTGLPYVLPGWGMFAENDHTVSPDFRAVHVYGNFYLVNFPVSPEDLASIL